MNLPNKITVFRVCMIPFFLLAFYLDFPYHEWIALSIFIIASFTDFLDGYIARKERLVTDFGKFLDPLADKLLVVSALIALIETGDITSLPVIIIISREFIVTGLRLIAASHEIVIAASPWGKFKTVSQMTLVIVLLIPFIDPTQLWVKALIVLSTALAIISGVDYLYKNKNLLKDY